MAQKAKTIPATQSLDDLSQAVRTAVREKFAKKPERNDEPDHVWAEVIYPDRVIVRMGSDLFAVPYTRADDGTVTFSAEPTKVRIAYVPLQEALDETAPRRDGWVLGPVQEGEAQPDGATWDVIVIEAGLSGNRAFYPREVLEEAAPLYEGTRLYMDHEEGPRKFGRSTRDLAGFLKNVHPVMVAHEAVGESTFALAGTACITKRAVRDELLEAWRLGKPDLFGLSHNVNARSQSMLHGGQPAVKVEAITKVSSVDFVTNPAAGGRVVRLAASADSAVPALEEDGRMLKKLLEQLRALNRPDLLESLGEEPTETQVLEAIQKALTVAPPIQTPMPTPTPAPVPTPAQPSGDATLLEAQRMLLEAQRANAELRIERDLADCALPEVTKTRVRTTLTKQLEAGRVPSAAEVQAVIREAVDHIGALVDAGVVLPNVGRPRAQVVKDRGDKFLEALNTFFDPGKAPTSFREIYTEFTGDRRVTGRLSEATRLSEALTSSSFDQALGDSIARRMLAYYASPDFANWRAITSTTNLNDFRTQRRVRLGGYGNLPDVSQGDPYNALTSPTDEEATYSATKRGGVESVTLEMIRNDDVGVIRDIPRRLGRAAGQTLYEFVWDFLANNGAVYDSTALAASGHNNIVTTALSASNLASLRLKLKAQTDMSSGKRLGLRARYLCVPNDLEELAYQLVTAMKAMPDSNIASTGEPAAPNFLQTQRIQVVPVDYWTDANNYWVTASPEQTPMIEVGFLDGNENPELFVQDAPNVGSMFNNDKLTWKIRHIYGGAVLDYRGFAAGIVA